MDSRQRDWNAPASGPRARRLTEFVLGKPLDRHLPRRVAQALSRHQRNSEILIGLCQLAATALFGVLYVVAPKTYPADAMFEPVPVALTAYALFTIIRLGLAITDRLSEPILWLSIIADVAVLLVTIWSFHIQYEQPPSFALKAPTMLYLFIIIALRTLRFEARYVLATGLLAAAGWVALIGYAIRYNPEDMGVTRDYIMYMYSSHILVGAEMDKVLAILAVTLILTLAILRGRRILVRSMADQMAAAELSRFFAPEVASAITGADAPIRPGEGMARHAACLFIDLRGFSALSRRLPANEQIAMLRSYQAMATRIIHAHGGSIERYLGDGILAHFGAAQPTGTFAADALRCAVAVLEAGGRWRVERADAGLPAPKLGCAVAAGEVIFGALGDESRLEYTIIGDSVNLAAKLESLNRTEKVSALTTLETHELAVSQGYAPPRRPSIRKGRRIPGFDATTDLVVLAR